MLLSSQSWINIDDISSIEWQNLYHVFLQSIEDTRCTGNPCIVSSNGSATFLHFLHAQIAFLLQTVDTPHVQNVVLNSLGGNTSRYVSS